MPNHERTEPSFSKTALMAALVIPALTVSLVWAGPQRDQYLWEQMQQHNFDLAAGGTLRVRVDDADLAIMVTTTSSTEVAIRLRSNNMEWARDRFERPNYRVREEGDTLVIESDNEPSNSWRSGSWMSVVIEVRLPSRFDLDLLTPDGDVSLEAFEGAATVRSQDGPSCRRNQIHHTFTTVC